MSERDWTWESEQEGLEEIPSPDLPRYGHRSGQKGWKGKGEGKAMYNVQRQRKRIQRQTNVQRKTTMKE